MGENEETLRFCLEALKETQAMHERVDRKALFERDQYEHAIFRHCQDSVAEATARAEAALAV